MDSENGALALDTSQEALQLLNSASASIVVERVAQVGPNCQREALAYAQKMARGINEQATSLSMTVYEETFGTRGRLHFLLHMQSLDGYDPAALSLAACLEDGGDDPWSRLFASGGVQDTVLMPQFWGMYGTRVDGTPEKQISDCVGTDILTLPPARQQTSMGDDKILHSGNAGIVMHRSAQVVYDFRSEARQFGREVAESINKKLPRECTVFVYEEAFGQADRLHWLIHLQDLTTYFRLLALHVRDEEVRNIYFRERIAPEKGGGTWARMFVDGTMADIALSPLGLSTQASHA